MDSTRNKEEVTLDVDFQLLATEDKKEIVREHVEEAPLNTAEEQTHSHTTHSEASSSTREHQAAEMSEPAPNNQEGAESILAPSTTDLSVRRL